MANAEAATAAVGAPVAKVPLMTMMLCVVVAVVLAVGGSGAVAYLVLKPRAVTAAEGTAGADKAKAEPVPTRTLTMEPLLANLADADGHAYLRLGVVLQIEDPPKKDKAKEKDAKEEKGPKAASPEEVALRDAVLDVLGKARSVELLAPDGKENLKAQMKEVFAKKNAETKVREIFFTDFLVQR